VILLSGRKLYIRR